MCALLVQGVMWVMGLASWGAGFGGGALGLGALTSGGLTATFRSAVEIARQTTKTTVLPSYARGTTRALCDYSRVSDTERNVGDGPTVVRARLNRAPWNRSRSRQGDWRLHCARCFFARDVHRAQCRRRSYRRTCFGKTERSEIERAHVRGTDGYISLGGW